MQISSYYLNKKEMELDDIEKWINLYLSQSNRYSEYDLEIDINEDDGTIDIWLDDHDIEKHLMTITPNHQSELKMIDEKGICGIRPS